MSKIYNNILELIGNTPLVETKNLEKELGLKARLLVKVEAFNPAGSVKDRIAYEMILDAEEKGILKKGSTIIEPTSGNTGIGLSLIALIRGYNAIIVMPETMSVERRNLMKAYGAQIVLTPGKLGMKGSIEKAKELEKEIKDAVILGQFDNQANPKAHYKTTGPEIWNDTDGNVDAFVSGVGTGGTISGVGKYLREKNKDIKIIAVEPESSPVLTQGVSGSHKIQGIGAGFVPKTLDTSIYDEVIDVKNEDAFEYARLLVKKEGIFAGISAGAALYAGIQLAKKDEYLNKTIVVLLPDSGDRYLSNELYNSEK